MNKNDLFQAVGQADDTLLLQSEQQKRSRKPWWIGAAAAVLALVLCLGLFLHSGGGLAVQVLAEPAYPKNAPYSADDDDAYETWWEDQQSRQPEPGYADSLTPFLGSSIRQFLSSDGNENLVFSPLNTYMALAMLAEITGGTSRQQILDLLGVPEMEALRVQAQMLWNAQYCDDGATTKLLASSLWLNGDLSFRQDTLDLLADSYYASSYRGTPGSAEMDKALQKWLNRQTGNLLEEQAGSVHLDPQTVLALASTICFRAKWADEFQETETADGIFHAPGGEYTVPFMHSFRQDTYYRGAHFGAVSIPLQNGAGAMWLLLPDEGYTPQELLQEGDTLSCLVSGGNPEAGRQVMLDLALPKFDVSSDFSLSEGLQALGITDVFSQSAADFSSLTEEPAFLSDTRQAVRVGIDETGITAAAFTVMQLAGGAKPPEETVVFSLDRPFLFAVSGSDGLPVFTGVVQNP